MEFSDRILRTPAAAEYTGLSVSTLEKLRLTSEGPLFVRIGIRAVGYRLNDLQTWLRGRVRASTSADAKAVAESVAADD